MKKFFALLLIVTGLQLLSASLHSQIKPVSNISTNLQVNPNLLFPDYSNVPARELNTFRNFKENFDGDNKVNAYLMGYVSCFVYPERIQRLLTGEIWDDNNPGNTNDQLFESNFKKKFEPLFWDGTAATKRPVIKFKKLPSNSPARNIGLDPEAVVISTNDFIIVAFRGTDRVLSQSDLVRSYGEWVGTDFRAPMATPGPGLLTGKVHEGFWKSVDLLRSDIDAEIIQNDPDHAKQVWITGHSLGAAQAEVYAQYLIQSGKVPSSKVHCYMYDGPSFVGDQTFANSVNTLGNKFQRFEYQTDMVSTISPGLATAVGPAIAAVLGNGCIVNCVYEKSGKRNWFESQNTYRFNFRERDFLLGDVFTLNSGCEHNPNWLVRSIYNTLSATEKNSVPEEAPCDRLAGCNTDCSPVTATSVLTAIANVAWQDVTNTLDNLKNNLIGGEDGQYKIACYDFKNWSKKYLTWDGTIDHQLTISTSGSVFTLTHKLTGGYQISRGGGNVASDVEYSLGIPNGNEKSNKVIMKPKDFIVGDEETWYILKVPNTSNAYVFYNWNTKKVMDADDNCIAGGDCAVHEAKGKSDNATQVWILEKVN
jgi:pimeloyl-ACP methyl ester carboxylesterase